MTTDIRQGILTKEEYLSEARLMYTPVILALQNREAHSVDFSNVKFKDINVEQESIVAEILTKEATEKAHIKARGIEKSFNIYLKGAKITQSLNDKQINLQKVHNRVIRDYSIIWDSMGLHGENGNNGLLSSTDEYYVTNANHEIPAAGAAGDDFAQVQDVNNLILKLKQQVSDTTSSQDVKIFVYGNDLLTFMGKITKNNETSVREILQKAFPAAMFIEVPSIALKAGDGNGFVVVSDDATTLHYTTEPTIKNQGENSEDNYYYANYVLGSVQVTPDLDGAIIKQPVTFA